MDPQSSPRKVKHPEKATADSFSSLFLFCIKKIVWVHSKQRKEAVLGLFPGTRRKAEKQGDLCIG